MKLYALTHELSQAIEKYQDATTDEELQALEQTINSIEVSFNDKAVGVAFYTLNLKSDITAIDTEIERLEGLKRTSKNRMEWFKEYLKRSMESVNLEKIDSPKIKISIRKNPASVVIDNEALIQDKYKRIIPETREPDKKLIMEAWKSGIGVGGTHIEDSKTNLQIK